jgi:hypothetical protein
MLNDTGDTMIRKVLLTLTPIVLVHLPLYTQNIQLGTPRDPLHVVSIPGEAPKKDPTTDAIYIATPQRGDGAWFSSQYAEYARAVTIVGVRTPEDCEAREVEFTYLSNASVSTAPPVMKARGEWVAQDSSNIEKYGILLDDDRLRSLFTGAPSGDYGNCVAIAHWRLGDNPGRHFLRARLLRKEGVIVPPAAAAQTTQLFTAIAHAPPAIVAGMVYVFDDADEQEEEGEGEESEEADRTLGAIVGFDFPIVIGALGADAQEFLEHFRPMVATNFSDPGEDVYVGLEVLPLLPRGGGARAAANPLQLTLGWKFDNDNNDGFFAGLHYSTTGLLSDFLKGIGL